MMEEEENDGEGNDGSVPVLGAAGDKKGDATGKTTAPARGTTTSARTPTTLVTTPTVPRISPTMTDRRMTTCRRFRNSGLESPCGGMAGVLGQRAGGGEGTR